MGAWSWIVDLVSGPATTPGGVRGDWSGVVLGCPVRVTPGRDSSHARFEVGGAPVGLRVHRRNGVDELLRAALVTGDRALDAVACIEGDRTLALALLRPEVRAAIVEASGHGLVLRNGVVRGEALKAVVPDLVTVGAELVRLMRLEENPQELLVKRFASEPVSSVRVQILRALLDTGADGPSEVVRQALDDQDAEVRLVAARGTRNAAALATLVVDPAASARVRDLAFQHLRAMDRAALVAGLAEALRDDTHALLALERAAATPAPELVGPILHRGERLLGDPIALAVEGPALLRAIAAHGPQAAGAVLLGVVEVAPPQLARHALITLRAAGPPGVLDSLAALAERRPELGEALGEAREQIEVRTRGEVLARLLALEWDPRSRAAVGSLAGLPFEVRLEEGQVGMHVSGLPAGVVVEPRGRDHAPLDDEPLFHALTIPGGASSVAWLPVDVRVRLAEVLDRAPRLRIGLGRLSAIGPMASGRELADRAQRIEALVRALMDLGALSPPARLEAACAQETRPALRRRLARQLLDDQPDRATAALRDPDPGVRLLAARRAGRADAIEALALEDIELPVRQDALVELSELGELERLDRAVGPALEHEGLRATALVLVGKHKLRAHADRIAAQLDRAGPGEPPWTRAALQVLAMLRVPSTERHLLRALWSPDPRIRRLAILALGEVGSTRAVPQLKVLASGWSVSRDVGAARAALEAIRARADVGGLSLARGDGGEVAIVSDGGEVSLTKRR